MTVLVLLQGRLGLLEINKHGHRVKQLTLAKYVKAKAYYGIPLFYIPIALVLFVYLKNMKNRLPLKHKLLCLDASQDVWFEPKEFINLCANARGYLVHESDLHMLVELVHRVINRDNFTEFAAKVNKEVLGND